MTGEEFIQKFGIDSRGAIFPHSREAWRDAGCPNCGGCNLVRKEVGSPVRCRKCKRTYSHKNAFHPGLDDLLKAYAKLTA